MFPRNLFRVGAGKGKVMKCVAIVSRFVFLMRHVVLMETAQMAHVFAKRISPVRRPMGFPLRGRLPLECSLGARFLVIFSCSDCIDCT